MWKRLGKRNDESMFFLTEIVVTCDVTVIIYCYNDYLYNDCMPPGVLDWNKVSVSVSDNNHKFVAMKV
jgi:hypothetical protein